MSRPARQLTREVLIYAGGNVAAKAAAFLLIPLYARQLTLAEYGVVALLGMFEVALTVLLGLGLASAIVKVYHDSPEPAGRREVVSTAAWLLALAALIGGAALWPLSGPLARIMLGAAERAGLVQMTLAATCLGLLRQAALAALRAQGRAGGYVALSLAHFVLLLGANAVLVGLLGRGLQGVVEANLGVAAVLGLVCIAVLLRIAGGQFAPDAARSLLRFGLPLVGGGLAAWVLTLSDHQFLQVYAGQAEVGIYALAYKFGMIVNMLLVQPFVTAWLPVAYAVRDRLAARRLSATTLTRFLAAGALLFLVVALPAREWLLLAATPAYLAGERIVALVALAYLARGAYAVASTGLLAQGRSGIPALITGGAAALNLALNVALIPRWGAAGAGTATLLSYLALAATMLLVAQRLDPVRYEWSRLGKLFGVTAAMFLAGSVIRAEGVALGVALKLAWIATWPLWLLMVRFFRW